jgi:DNA-binding transcriptional MerR regulator
MRDEVIGRKGLARILDVSESTTRNLERRGEIQPEAIVDGRALFSAEKARKLRATRDARREDRPASGSS